MIEPTHLSLSIARQCALLGLARSSYYAPGPGPESAANLAVLAALDRHYTARPFYGSRRLMVVLHRAGWAVNRKRVQRLMRLLGLHGLAPGRRTTRPAPGHRVYPYLLRGVAITHRDQVWSSDITYVPLAQGFMYLTVVLDWYSRYVLAWALSNTLDSAFCVTALTRALAGGCPEVFNTDQGSQYTSEAFTGVLQGAGVQISMDGRGRALDNVFVERLWRSVKYEDIYLNRYETAWALTAGLAAYFRFYNQERPHQALAYQTPEAVYAQEEVACQLG